MEVDNGSKPISYWVQKIGSWTGGNQPPDIVFISLNPERLKRVFYALKESNIKGRISFEPLELFLEQGFASRTIGFKNNPGLWFYNQVTQEFLRHK
jgi:hypothetical protein